MSAPPQEKGAPITDRRQLVEYLEAGCKPKPEWRIGTEHEKFGYTHDDLRPLPYEGERGIRALLEGIAREFGWECVNERAGRSRCRRRAPASPWSPAASSSSPGARSRPCTRPADEVHEHLDQVRAVAAPLGIGMLGVGFQPKWRRDEIPWMPKGRYGIMRRYMPTRGSSAST